MKYFILKGIFPNATEQNIPIPREQNETAEQREATYERLNIELPSTGDVLNLSLPNIGSLSVFVYDIDQASFIVKSTTGLRSFCRNIIARLFSFQDVGVITCNPIEGIFCRLQYGASYCCRVDKNKQPKTVSPFLNSAYMTNRHFETRQQIT